MEADLRSNASTPASDLQGNKRPAVESNNNSGGGDRKIQRVTRACDACKLRKSRCSGTNPCSSCVSKRLECHYLSKYGRGRPPTPVATPISSTGTTSSIAHVGPGEASTPIGLGTTSACTSHREGGWPSPPRASTEATMTEIQGQYFDTTSGLAFLHRAWKGLSASRRQVPFVDEGEFVSREKHQPQVAAGDKPFDESLSSDEQPFMPERSEAFDLFVLYFDECIATYRFVHRPTVEQWLNRIIGNSEQGLPYHHGVGESKASIVFGMLAIAQYHKGQGQSAMVREEEALRTRRSDQLFTRARRMTKSATGFPNLESVQARLIQVLYLLHTSRMNQAWYVFGNSLQMIAALGLHRLETRTRNSASKNSQIDYIRSQSQRRVFWVSYILDQYLGVLFGRPRHYHDDDIDQPFPDCVDDEDMAPEGPRQRRTKDCTVSALVFHAKITKVLGQITRNMYSANSLPGGSLSDFLGRVKSDICEWKAQLPPFLGAINPSSLVRPFRRQATALRLAYAHAVIHATRPFLLGTIGGSDAPSHRNSEPISECISSARFVLETVDTMAGDGPLFHAFWWTHYVTFCALAVVYIWEIQRHLSSITLFGPDYYEQLFELAEKCQTHLAEATASNSPGRRYSIILRELQIEAKRTAARTATRPLSLHDGRSVLGYDNVEGEEHRSNAKRYDLQSAASKSVDVDNGLDAYHNLWDNWQTADWLEIDSLAFGQFPALGSTSGSWFTDMPVP